MRNMVVTHHHTRCLLMCVFCLWLSEFDWYYAPRSMMTIVMKVGSELTWGKYSKYDEFTELNPTPAHPILSKPSNWSSSGKILRLLEFILHFTNIHKITEISHHCHKCRGLHQPCPCTLGALRIIYEVMHPVGTLSIFYSYMIFCKYSTASGAWYAHSGNFDLFALSDPKLTPLWPQNWPQWPQNE